MSRTRQLVCGAALCSALLQPNALFAQTAPPPITPAPPPDAEATEKAAALPPEAEPPTYPAPQPDAAAPANASADAPPPAAQAPAAGYAAPGFAQDFRMIPVQRPREKPAPEPEGPYVAHWLSAEIGVRNFVIFDSGFDPYSDTDLLAQGAFTLNFVPLRAGAAGLGLSAEYDVGERSHDARTVISKVTMHRLGLGVTAQVELSRFRIFARAVPAAWYARASLEDAGFERPLVARGWTWGFDAVGGAAVRLGSAGGPSNDPAVRFWLLAELGYGFGGRIGMVFGPEEDDEDPRQFGAVSLPELKPAGLLNRLAMAVSF